MIPNTKPSPKSQGPERDQEPLKEDFKKKPFRNLQQSRKPFKKETFKEVLKEPLREPSKEPCKEPRKEPREALQTPGLEASEILLRSCDLAQTRVL